MKLILFNGPAGVGKTTIAAMLHDSMPLSFLLDLDAQREFISQWKEYRVESRVLSFAIALNIAETCFKHGTDFISGKGMFDAQALADRNNSIAVSNAPGIIPGDTGGILDSFVELGHRYGADVHEIFLWGDKDVVLNRAKERGYQIKPTHSPEQDVREWEIMKSFKDRRPNAAEIDTTNLSPEEVLTRVKGIVGIK